MTSSAILFEICSSVYGVGVGAMTLKKGEILVIEGVLLEEGV